jgi:hypothetical protein
MCRRSWGPALGIEGVSCAGGLRERACREAAAGNGPAAATGHTARLAALVSCQSSASAPLDARSSGQTVASADLPAWGSTAGAGLRGTPVTDGHLATQLGGFGVRVQWLWIRRAAIQRRREGQQRSVGGWVPVDPTTVRVGTYKTGDHVRQRAHTHMRGRAAPDFTSQFAGSTEFGWSVQAFAGPARSSDGGAVGMLTPGDSPAQLRPPPLHKSAPTVKLLQRQQASSPSAPCSCLPRSPDLVRLMLHRLAVRVETPLCRPCAGCRGS